MLGIAPASAGLWLLGTVGLLGGQTLDAQVVIQSTTAYTFRAWSGAAAALVMTSDISGQTGNNNSTDVSAVLTSVSGKPAVPAVDLAGQLGWQSGAFFNTTTGTYYNNAASAVALTFTVRADKKQTGTAGAFTVVFDTTGDGTLGSNDQGLALNTTFTASSNTVTIAQTSLVAFTLAANSGVLTPTSALAIASATPLGNYTASINGSVTGSGSASDGNNYTVALAALLSDVSVNWHPAAGTPTLTTAFTSGVITAAGSVNFIDWYGASASAAQDAALSVPEPATWVSSLGAIGPGIYLLLRRRRQKSSSLTPTDFTARRARSATPSGKAAVQP